MKLRNITLFKKIIHDSMIFMIIIFFDTNEARLVNFLW